MSADSPATRILITDDEAGLRDALEYGLKKRGYEVATASSGEAALALIRENTYDIVVCDIMMPGIDGLETLKELKSIAPDVEVVMATGYASLESAIEAMKRGASDYITKPYSIAHLCTLFDKILEHRRLKARISHLEEVNRLKSEFVATMNHELRTPLTSILGFIDLLLRQVYGNTSEHQGLILKRVQLSAQHLLQMVNDVLDLSKLSANRMSVLKTVFNAGDLLKEVMDSAESLAKAKSIALLMECPEPVWLETDRNKLRQVLLNLVGNGIKFTSTGSVTLRVKQGETPTQVTLEVHDTGLGIEAKNLSLLFKEFQQIDGTSTREYGGTGLGLAISKKLVDLLGGDITVSSRPGEGSTFSISLHDRIAPPDRATAAPGAVLAVPRQHPDERIILGIDDYADILKVLSDCLQGTGVRFVGAQSGEEGIRLAQQLKPDLITLDIMMPHMDGWAVVRMLKDNPALKDIPIYVVSIVENEALALSLGVTDCLIKPFNRDQLLAKLSLIPQNRLKQILVVDDDAAVRESVGQALTEAGFDVGFATTGEEVVDRLQQLHPDVLLLNWVLPGLSGLEVLQEIDQHVTEGKMSIFVLTERDLTEEETRFLERRVHKVLKKRSLNVEALRDAVRASLTNRRSVA